MRDSCGPGSAVNSTACTAHKGIGGYGATRFLIRAVQCYHSTLLVCAMQCEYGTDMVRVSHRKRKE